MGAGEMGGEPHDEGEFSFTGDVGELGGNEAFGVGVEAGREMIKNELENLLQDLEKPYVAEMEDEGPAEESGREHPGQSCEEVHPGAPHMREEY